jgi:gamma-glutamyltranspeptidase/glutathione hydrolase
MAWWLYPCHVSQAAISCGSAPTARAGADALEAGGNAVDAAVAAAFASTIAEPGVSSLGGGGFLLVRLPDGSQEVLDFFTSVPSGPAGKRETVTVVYSGATQDFHVGTATVAVPGCLDGFLTAHRLWGRLPLSEVIAPAIDFAENGVLLDARQAHAMALIEPVLLLTEASRERMAPDGVLLGEGDHYRDPELAALLRRVADGRVRGVADLVDEFAALMPAGPVTGADLRAFAPERRAPLVASIRSGSITTNPLPSLGGTIVAHVLRDLADESHPTPRAIAEALVETTAWLKAQVTGPVSAAGTTHISVVDQDSMAAALTLSNGVGGGVFLPGTGIHLNNMMGEDDLHPGGPDAAVPGERIRSMMAPSIVDHAGGSLVLGTGGSERIRSALTRVITLILGGDADLAGAVEAPRVHVDNQGVIQVEPGLPVEQVEELQALGEVSLWPERHFYFGGVNAVHVGAQGETSAHADPRRGGAAIVV